MELIPILATIILVATISTFVLSVGAYVLYKVRERKSQEVEVVQPETIQAELFTPEAVAEQVKAPETVRAPAPGRIIFEQPKAPMYKAPVEPIFVQQKAPAMQPMQAKQQVPQPGQFIPSSKPEVQKTPQPGPGQAQQSEKKFMKVTAEGKVSAKEEKVGGAVKWR